MSKRFRARISSAHVLAAMALFVALGGSAYAVKKNSIGTKQLKNNAVKTKKIADNAVTTQKVADGAITGAKVDEASLGKVPSAQTADSAATAQSAQTADSAATATDAENAANAGALQGRTLGQIRPFIVGTTSNTTNGLPDDSFETVLSASIQIPSGGADLVVNASVELVNNGVPQAGGQCRLRSDNLDISQTYDVTLPSGHSKVISMVGFANDLPATSIGDPENVAVLCGGSIAPNNVAFSNGDMTAQRIPVAAG